MNENQTKPTFIKFDCPRCAEKDVEAEFINVNFNTDCFANGAWVECPCCREYVDLDFSENEQREKEMKRLTYFDEEYNFWTYSCPSGDVAKRLAELENALENGTLIKKDDNYSAVQFVEDYKRMCKRHFVCFACPIFNDSLTECPLKRTEKHIKLVHQWAIDNPIEPVKTYKDDFFEKFPNAQKEINGTPKSCTKLAYGEGVSCYGYNPMTCEECWNRPMEDKD